MYEFSSTSFQFSQGKRKTENEMLIIHVIFTIYARYSKCILNVSCQATNKQISNNRPYFTGSKNITSSLEFYKINISLARNRDILLALISSSPLVSGVDEPTEGVRDGVPEEEGGVGTGGNVANSLRTFRR